MWIWWRRHGRHEVDWWGHEDHRESSYRARAGDYDDPSTGHDYDDPSTGHDYDDPSTGHDYDDPCSPDL
jgi:hypothetical protein